MAASSKTTVEVTHCPSCQSLCLSPTILPCGHVVCRKCLRKTLEDRGHMSTCPSCSHSLSLTKGQTISELAEELGKDLVLEDLVTQQLALQGQVYCLVCPNKVATTVCVDCGGVYCQACSRSHKKMTTTKDHLQQDLLHTLLSAPPTARQTPKPKDDVISYTSEDSTRYDHDTRLRQNTDNELLKQEARLCQEGASLLNDAVRAVEANIVQLQEVKNRLENKQQLLLSYAAPLCSPDDVMMANARAMLPRVKRVREDCRPPNKVALAKLTEQINTLIDKSAVTPGPTAFDPMTSVPRKTFTVMPDVVGDTSKDGPNITCIVATGDGRLVMADDNNYMIKVADLTDPANSVRGVNIDTMPYCLALLPDNQVAVTALEKIIYFVDISGQLSVASRVKTVRQYWGVASVPEDDTLVVGCKKDDDGIACVVVITRAGVMMRTVVDSNTIPDLKKPNDLCLVKGCILVSDFKANAVHRVELATGHVVAKLIHEELYWPSHVTSDSHGNCYIASIKGQCVLVYNPTGQWRRLLYGPQDGDGPRVDPLGVCVTNTGIAVSWNEILGFTVVVGYDLT